MYRHGPRQLTVVRHAESERNAAKQGSIHFDSHASRSSIMGIPDHEIGITPRGRDQATATGTALRRAHPKPDIIYHSGYARTEATTRCLLDAYENEGEGHSITVRPHLFLRERDPGYPYDMLQSEVDHHFPWLAQYWETFGGFFAHPVGGESIAQVAERVWHFLEMLKREHDDEHVMLVTHGGTIRCIRYWLEHLAYRDVRGWPGKTGKAPENCSVTVYKRDSEGQLKLQEYETVYWQ